MKTYVVTPHYNRINETILMMGHNVCLEGTIWKINPKLSLLPLLILSTVDREEFLCTVNLYTSHVDLTLDIQTDLSHYCSN